ncbi:hypothetical protein ACQEVF_35510 [Nonomuraea polychroma]|uniref:hypothetical protein n=1 Tax=Nonomuraea polychroma TaxID=46176 RepID=UPI003D89C79A
MALPDRSPVTADDLFAYAAQLGLRTPPLDRYVPFALMSRRQGGPTETIRADLAACCGPPAAPSAPGARA